MMLLFIDYASTIYWVTILDVTQETEEWAELAALASAAHFAHFFVSCATSCLVTKYMILTQSPEEIKKRNFGRHNN